MTSYGTIPTSSSPVESGIEFISREKARVKAALEARRPWKEFAHPHAFSLPHGLSEARFRARTNLNYFTMNYAIVVLAILFISLIWHPVSLIVLTVMMAAWLFLYFTRDEPLVVFGRAVSDKAVLLGLSVVTVVALIFTDVTVNVVSSVAVGLGLVVVHGVLRKTEDLCLDDGWNVGP